MSAADELEALFDKRLNVEVQKLKRIAAERDDIQFKLEEQAKRNAAQHRVRECGVYDCEVVFFLFWCCNLLCGGQNV